MATPMQSPKVSVAPLSVNASDRLIVALDLDSVEKAQRMVEELGDLVSFFKVGLELDILGGAKIVEWLIGRGKKVFLDLKFNDVPETVTRATRAAARLGISFLTVHGDGPTVRAAVAGRDAAKSNVKLLAVTVLTSFDEQDIKDIGFAIPLEELILRRAKTARELGCDGVIASGQEAGKIRQAVGPEMLIVTPGIRPSGAASQDQKRVTTPGDALVAGADYLVLGRAITGSADPRAAAEAVIAEMNAPLR
jgi:orotidine-5'-phosphate decarboxylase